MVRELATEAAFPQGEFERERRQKIEEVKLDRTQPGFLGSERLRKVLFGSHPYAQVAPTEEQVAAYKRDDLLGVDKTHVAEALQHADEEPGPHLVADREARTRCLAIDDLKGETLASASSIEKEMRGSLKNGANIAAAKAVGKLLAERAAAKGVKDVVFDRGGYLYHGRVKALADAAREAGLNF